MEPRALRALLTRVQTGELEVDDAVSILATLPFADLGHAKIDHHRALRTGMPEVVYGEGKTPWQILDILGELRGRGQTSLVTRVTPEAAAHVRASLPEVEHHPTARILVLREGPPHDEQATPVAIVSAGTSDQAVAEEAAVTADVLGLLPVRVYDVGVAGLHRVLAHRDRIEACRVVIVVAGMEGALASVVAGLVSRPVVAVPTSVGYGASFGGLAALLGMLSGCAPGVSVVNIDNGFGAACVAARLSHAAR